VIDGTSQSLTSGILGRVGGHTRGLKFVLIKLLILLPELCHQKFTLSSAEPFSCPLPFFSERVKPSSGGSADNENNPRLKRPQIGQSKKGPITDSRLPVTASGTWSTDWDGLLARIGDGGENGENSASEMVLCSIRSMDSLNAVESSQSTALLLPRGPAQVRRASSLRTPLRSNWRLGGFFSGDSVSCTLFDSFRHGTLIQDPQSKISSLLTKHAPRVPPNPQLQDTSFVEVHTPAVLIRKPVECQVHLPSILSVLDDAVDSKKSNGVIRVLSMASMTSRTSLLGPKGKAQRTSLMPAPPSIMCPTFSLPGICSSSGPHLCLRGTARSTRESGIGDILGHFPDPPMT
jgi:hypothetical protein